MQIPLRILVLLVELCSGNLPCTDARSPSCSFAFSQPIQGQFVREARNIGISRRSLRIATPNPLPRSTEVVLYKRQPVVNIIRAPFKVMANTLETGIAKAVAYDQFHNTRNPSALMTWVPAAFKAYPRSVLIARITSVLQTMCSYQNSVYFEARRFGNQMQRSIIMANNDPSFSGKAARLAVNIVLTTLCTLRKLGG